MIAPLTGECITALLLSNAALQGIEPQSKAPKASVLPLDERAMMCLCVG